MNKTPLAVAALLTSLSMAAFLPAAYAEDGMNLNGTEVSTEQGCKKCKCDCDQSCDDCSGSVDAMADKKDNGQCSKCDKCNDD